MLFFFSHAFSFHVSHSYVFPSSLRLTWLADPALVTSVYPNRVQYTPRVLQEVSLLDGVDAGVRGNGRRFSKTSSYPPCRRYAFTLFYPYFSHDVIVPFVPADSLLSHDPLHPVSPYKSFPHSLPPLFPSLYHKRKHFLFMAEQCS